MKHWCIVALCALLSAPASVGADLETEEAWLKDLRGSGSYREGLANVDRLVTAAYDIGAIAGASHWEEVHAYYTDLARMKGCETGAARTKGRGKPCPKVSGPEPETVAKDYGRGKARVVELAADATHPDLVKRVLQVLYDYGYAQGLKHGLRVHNDDIRLAQTFYRSCMERALDADGERLCSKRSKAWSRALVARLKKEIETNPLTAKR